MSSLIITGTLCHLFPAQSFPSGFTKQEFVIMTDDRYPQPVKFEAIKERRAQLDGLKEGDRLNVFFNVRGNEFKERFFVNLVAWKIEPATGAAAHVPAASSSVPPPRPRATAPATHPGARPLGFDAPGVDEDVPF